MRLMISEKSLSTWFKYLNFKIVVQSNFPLYPILTQFAGILLKMKLRKLYSFRRKKDTYAITDLTFLVLFPFLFLLFNLLYWSAVHYTRYEVSQTSFITRNGNGILIFRSFWLGVNFTSPNFLLLPFISG